ncbi:Ig-like domain-containing protein [Deinococcus misasensis]|uniref:Ig-like domain-containing protein n=1 Tax=Deinococcus misasensis TaxID=392413 RepID=UPI00068A3368|nr:Ig-like domain-containing protein [Deinococcus misasensis]
MSRARTATLALLLGFALYGCSQSTTQEHQHAIPQSTPDLRATFGVDSAWTGGYNGSITLRNNSTSNVEGWTLQFKFAGDASIGSVWGAAGSFTRNADGSYTLKPNSWGGATLKAGSTSLIQYSGNGTFSGVTSCTLNGQPCSGGTGSDTTPPTVSLQSSQADFTAAGTLNLTATATDNVGVTRVEFYQNDVKVAEDTTSPYTFSKTFSDKTQNGMYMYTAKALDAVGNSAESGMQHVLVDIGGSGNTTPPPGGVSAGPETFSQLMPNATQLDRCATSPNYDFSTPNPILSESPVSRFTSNVPLTLSVVDRGGEWYGDRVLVFTNRSSKIFHIDCAVIIFKAASGSASHNYWNSVQPFGHPQQDYVEVPMGNGISHYIVRLGFHDVPLDQRIAYPGKPFEYRLGGYTGSKSPISVTQTRDSVQFFAELDLQKNDALVKKYGTKRYAN